MRQPAATLAVPSSGPRVWSRYRDNLPRHLIGISRHLQSRVMASLAETHGQRGLRLSFGPFLSLIWDDGRPLTTIAGELRISRQAAGQLANLVERVGYIERVPNPLDRRSKVLILTPAGRQLVEQGAALIRENEAAWAALVGKRAYRRFTTTLAELYGGLRLPAQATPAATAQRTRSAGVLPLIVERVQHQLMQATIERGHPGLKLSHGQILPLIGPDGARVHAIARLQQVSRQAISAISRELERLGYLTGAPDASDGRGVVLTLTPRGETLIADSVDAVGELEATFRDRLGSDSLAHLQDVARALYQALHLEEEVFEARRAEASAPPDGEIEQLAATLRRQLGNDDATRLAALLEPRARRNER